MLEATQRIVLKVSEITNDIKDLLEDNFHSIWVEGEISNFKSYASGHFYFTLKDENSQISGVMFKGYNQRLKFDLEDGLKIVAHGRISVYGPRGNYQLMVDHMEPAGIGALQLAFDQLKAKLKAEGLFEAEHKKPIPPYPQKIGIITSLHGAAVHDIVSVIRRRYPNMDLLIYPVKVQGEGSKEEIVEALHYFTESQSVDTIILGRGGGSLEDLWSFNEEAVARAIYNCPLPIISAVGHEVDFSISDFVADLRAPTPSAAAELAVPQKDQLQFSVQQQKLNLTQTIKALVLDLQKQVQRLKKSVPTPLMVLEQLRFKVGHLQDKLFQNQLMQVRHLKVRLAEIKFRLASPAKDVVHIKNKVQRLQKDLISRVKMLHLQRKNHFQQQNIKLTLLSPQNTLKRGFTMTRTLTGQVVSSRSQVKMGQDYQVVFADGTQLVKALKDSK